MKTLWGDYYINMKAKKIMKVDQVMGEGVISLLLFFPVVTVFNSHLRIFLDKVGEKEGETERNICVRGTHQWVASYMSPDYGPVQGGACNRGTYL